jgi:hypothetical protein
MMQFSELPGMPFSRGSNSLEGFLNIIGKKKKPSTGLVWSNLLRIYTGIKSITDFQ